MKFKAPEGCTEASVGGETFNVGADGCITVPENGNYLTLLAPHGFTVAEDQGVVEEPIAPALSTPDPVIEEVKEVVEEEVKEEAFNPIEEEVKPKQEVKQGKRK